jgi:hypothetical protein
MGQLDPTRVISLSRFDDLQPEIVMPQLNANLGERLCRQRQAWGGIDRFIGRKQAPESVDGGFADDARAILGAVIKRSAFGGNSEDVKWWRRFSGERCMLVFELQD